MRVDILAIIKNFNIVDCRCASARLRGEERVHGEGVLKKEIDSLVSTASEDVGLVDQVLAALSARQQTLEGLRRSAYEAQKQGANKDACSAFEAYFKELGAEDRDPSTSADYRRCRYVCNMQLLAKHRVRKVLIGVMSLVVLAWLICVTVYPFWLWLAVKRSYETQDWATVKKCCAELNVSWLNNVSFGLVSHFSAKSVTRVCAVAEAGYEYNALKSKYVAMIASKHFEEAYQELGPFVRTLGVDVVIASGVSLAGPLTFVADPGSSVTISSISKDVPTEQICTIPSSGILKVPALPAANYNFLVEKKGYVCTNIAAQMCPFMPLQVVVRLHAMPMQVNLVGPATTLVSINTNTIGKGGDTVLLPCGTSTLHVQSPHCKTQSVIICGGPGEAISVELPALEPLHASLYVNAVTDGAASGQLSEPILGQVALVNIDGVDRGAYTLPAVLMVDVGIRYVKLALPHYVMSTDTVKTLVSEGVSNAVVVALKADPARISFISSISNSVLTVNAQKMVISGSDLQISSGIPHSFTVTAPGYQAWAVSNVFLTPGEVRVISPSLCPLPGFSLKCNVPNTRVVIDGLSATPLSGRYTVREPGSYTISVEADGFDTWICSNALIKSGVAQSLTPVLIPSLEIEATKTIYYEEGTGYLKCNLIIKPNSKLVPVSRDFVLMLDTSFSMSKFYNKYDRVLDALFEQCGPDDRLEVVCFAASVKQCFGEPKKLDDLTKSQARQFIRSFSGGSSTDLEVALASAVKMRNMFSSNHQVILCIVSDGVPTAGATSIAKLFAKLSSSLQKNLAIYTIIAGNPSEDLCDILAWRYGGAGFYIEDADGICDALKVIMAQTDNVILNSCSVVCPEATVSPLQSSRLNVGTTNAFYVAFCRPVERLICHFSGLWAGRIVERDIPIDIREAASGDACYLSDWRKGQIYQLYWDALELDGSDDTEKRRSEAQLSKRFSLVSGYIPVAISKKYFKKRYVVK